ncbi:hypothetical protein HZH66_005324 [Vespula vulgaris]|uniref:Uncharacterized protein n=1 Tax=Vespula vulgaris TaxID=7454 RepID=A0A834KAE2_VESVU|nr:hypothetical protein HZH66_005324 [Vespula vulgaris]
MPLDSAKEERIPLDGYAGDFETPQKETWNRIGSLRRHKEPAARIPKAKRSVDETLDIPIGTVSRVTLWGRFWWR